MPHLPAILAHQIGHYALSPGSAEQQARINATAFVALSQERAQMQTPVTADELQGQMTLLANLWQDLLIDTRLQLERDYPMLPLIQALQADSDVHSETESDADFRDWVLRVCEIRWGLSRNQLRSSPSELDPLWEADARLAAQVIQPASRQPLAELDVFVRIACRYLPASLLPEPWLDAPRSVSPDEKGLPGPSISDSADASSAQAEPIRPSQAPQAVPPGLSQIPRPGPDLLAEGLDDQQSLNAKLSKPPGLSLQNSLEPPAYAHLLAASGLKTQGWLTRYYAEQAWPWLLPELNPAGIHQPEPGPFAGTEPWELDRPVTDIDWTASLIQSPVVVPGMTTLRRRREPEPDALPRPLERIDLYLDASGSVPDPAQTRSALVLHAVILTLSALRLGLTVRVTCFSGQQDLIGTAFTHQRQLLLDTLVTYPGGTTSFPLPLLQQRYAQAAEQNTRVVILSDEGWEVCLLPTPEGIAGEVVLEQALQNSGAGGSLLLQLLRPQSVPAGLQGLINSGWGLQSISADQMLTRTQLQALLQ